MKLIRLSFFWLFLILLFSFSSFVRAYDLSSEDRSFVEKIVRSYSEKQKNLNTQIQKNNYQKFATMTLLIEDKSADDLRNQALIWYFKVLVDIKIKELPQVDLLKTDEKVSYGKYNVDIQKIRDYRLSLHNKERKIKWLSDLNYNSQLEQTAYTWAKNLWDNGQDRLRKATRKYSTHWRKSGDGYYNYGSIKERFGDQWVAFAQKEKNWQSLFTENIWRWYFRCKDSECTDEIEKAIKTTRDMFMKEKKYNWAHYKWITGNYKNVWVWVYLFGDRYVVVTHYGTSLLAKQ